MSYCRFSDGDVYLYAHVGGGFECCACSIAEPIKSIFTVGYKNHPLFGDIEPCEKCGGEGCDCCNMPGNTHLNTRSECIEHLKKHKNAGHRVPGYAFKILKEELEEAGEMNEPYFEDGYDGPVVVNFKDGTVKKATDLLDELENEDEDRD